ncbi:MAG: DUF2167 domain-containing protein [Massilia sp.]
MLKNLAFALFLLTCGVAGTANAADPTAPQMTEAQFVATLSFQEGKINLPGGMATLDLPPNFRYLSPADTERVLTQAWGNPPGGTTLGMILPANVSLQSDEGWGVIITYKGDGHVKDDDAEATNYDKLLKEMQEGTEESNEERKKLGYSPMTLVGWAEKPSYDKASHKLYWALDLKTGGQTNHSLNYNIRVLGRQGVLVLNAISSMEQIGKIRTEMQKVTAFSDFTPGNRYADFNSSTDKTAEYGIAALVLGGIAAKAGLFGKLFVILLALKKFLVVGVLAIGAAIGKLFGRKSDKVDLDK